MSTPDALSPLMYLACPYTHPDSARRHMRWEAASRAAAWLMSRGYVVVSPISMGHPIGFLGDEFGLGYDFAAWERTSMTLLQRSTSLTLLPLDGWRESKGVRAELVYARRVGMAVRALIPMNGIYTLEDFHGDQ